MDREHSLSELGWSSICDRFRCLRQRTRISSADSRTSVRRALATRRLPRGNTRLRTSHPAKPGRMAGTAGLLSQTKTTRSVLSPGFRRFVVSCLPDQPTCWARVEGGMNTGRNRMDAAVLTQTHLKSVILNEAPRRRLLLEDPWARSEGSRGCIPFHAAKRHFNVTAGATMSTCAPKLLYQDPPAFPYGKSVVHSVNLPYLPGRWRVLAFLCSEGLFMGSTILGEVIGIGDNRL